MDKQIVIEEYNSDWSIQFEKEKEKLKQVLNNDLLPIEHIGSTSVKGLAAKPIIDIMIGVKSLSEVDIFIEPLKPLGYEYVFHTEFPQRRFFRKGKWRAGTHHLHIYEYNSKFWINNILFRNYLRDFPDTKLQYNQLKKDLAVKYEYDRIGYTSAKAPFISNVINLAKKNYNN
ncbi:GrpB family protein [Chengkuizengella marina]|uniref:GrpB family protein n=1 Tax=Chengkuizengella marina TaxID=2507566 RepID=A0A6N9PYW6_9BACL|nr:GrpB family protein [Chengkuizengella marina]NBI28157.1 GrpB family protein [Chengkuizengella marina]